MLYDVTHSGQWCVFWGFHWYASPFKWSYPQNPQMWCGYAFSSQTHTKTWILSNLLDQFQPNFAQWLTAANTLYRWSNLAYNNSRQPPYNIERVARVMVLTTSDSPHPSQPSLTQLHRLVFCRGTSVPRSSYTLVGTGTCPPPNFPFLWISGPPSNTWCLGLEFTRVTAHSGVTKGSFSCPEQQWRLQDLVDGGASGVATCEVGGQVLRSSVSFKTILKRLKMCIIKSTIYLHGGKM